jgi:hypothetical protein
MKDKENSIVVFLNLRRLNPLKVLSQWVPEFMEAAEAAQRYLLL